MPCAVQGLCLEEVGVTGERGRLVQEQDGSAVLGSHAVIDDFAIAEFAGSVVMILDGAKARNEQNLAPVASVCREDSVGFTAGGCVIEIIA